MPKSDYSAQIKQIDEHYRALRLDMESAELAGAALPGIQQAREMLDEAVRIAKRAIESIPDRLNEHG